MKLKTELTKSCVLLDSTLIGGIFYTASWVM